MVLIQLGGLNFITFTSLFALLANPGIGTRYKSMLQASYSAESLETSVQLTGQIVRFSLLFEAVSAALLFISWGDQHFATVGDRIFHSLFHAISAFNNAGFSLYTGGLADASLLHQAALGMRMHMLHHGLLLRRPRHDVIDRIGDLINGHTTLL